VSLFEGIEGEAVSNDSLAFFVGMSFLNFGRLTYVTNVTIDIRESPG
jgi:hypothetical protein